jgi:hypothetical protein
MNSKGGGGVVFDGDRATFESAIDNESHRAPLTPEIVAASFEDEAEKPETIQDFFGALDPGQNVDVPLMGHIHEEEIRGEIEDYEAPRPPEIIAAAFEKGRGPEEAKREDGEDDEAPRPPDMIAASYEAMDDFDREAKKKPINIL